MSPREPAAGSPDGRAAWADLAKGCCIGLVVLWHVVAKHVLRIDWHVPIPVPGAWNVLCEQLLPVRMPLFFTVSGLFAAHAVARPWPVLLRSRVARFGYLYLLWLLIHTALLAATPGFPTDAARSWPELLRQASISPSNLWFVVGVSVLLHRVLRPASGWLFDLPGNRPPRSGGPVAGARPPVPSPRHAMTRR